MKKIISIFLFAFTLILFNGCSSDSNISEEISTDLSAKFISYEKEFQNQNTKSKVNLYDKLSHTSNYENSIFKFITKDKTFDDNVASIYSQNIGYNKHTDFDRDFFMRVLNDFTSLDTSNFFSKMDYYNDFINNEIKDNIHRDYLLSTLEELKWSKYSILYVQNNSSSVAKANGDACFDACMESGIEDQFDWWGGWVQFVIAPGPTVAWIAGECISNCYF